MNNILKIFAWDSNCILSSWQDATFSSFLKNSRKLDGSPGLVVMGGNSSPEIHGFESQHCILVAHFFTYICCKNCNICLKRRKWIKKRPGLAHFLKIAGNDFVSLRRNVLTPLGWSNWWFLWSLQNVVCFSFERLVGEGSASVTRLAYFLNVLETIFFQK